EIDGVFEEFVILHHFVDETVVECFVRRKDALPHEEVDRLRETDELHDEGMPAFVRLKAETQRRRTETRAARGDTEVACERERQSRLDGDAIDRCDRDLVEVADGEVQL